MDRIQQPQDNLLNRASAATKSARDETSEIVPSTTRLIQVATTIAGVISLCSLVGWAFDWPSLARWSAFSPRMVPETALGIVSAALALNLSRQVLSLPRSRRLNQCTGGFLVALGLINLIAHTSIFSEENLGFLTSPSFQMAQGSAIAFFMLGSSLLLLSRQTIALPALWTLALFGTAITIIGLITVFGFLCGLYTAPWWGTFFLHMAFPTAICCCTLGTALVSIFFQQTSGTAYQFSVTAAALAILGLLLLFAGVDAAVLAGSNSLLNSRQVARKASDEMRAIQDIIECVRRAESGQRGYLLTGERQYLSDFYIGRSGFERATRDKSIDDSLLISTIALKFDELDRTIALETAGHHREAVATVRSSYGIRLMKQIDIRQKVLYDRWQQKLIIRREDGQRALLSIQKTVLASYGMAVVFALGAVLLIAAEMKRRSRIETELRQAETRINNELRRQTLRAEEANRAKSNFLASMSHEIRTPMNAILGMADMLWETELSQTQRHYVEIFRRAGGNLLTLINDILDLSKIESGNFSLEHIDFDLVELVQQSMEILAPKAEAKGLILTADIEAGTSTKIVGDSVRLQQILLNLLGNAVKFTEQGSVALRIWSHDVTDQTTLEFEITDTGVGIPEDKLGTIFEDFTQAESSITRRYGGTGLGLSICRRLVDRMGGKLQVRSQLESGSIFSFNIVMPISADQQSAKSAEFVDIIGKKVLIVDNNSTNRTILSVMCSVWGMLVTTCSSGLEAIEAARSDESGQAFDVALIDRLMPGIDGFRTALEVRLHQPAVAIIIVSSDNRPGDASRCRELGFCGHLLKPVRRASLLQQILKALNRVEEVPSPQANLLPEKSAESAVQPRIQVLAAEDSEDNRFLIEAYCAGTKYDLTFANNGAQAVEAVQNKRFDIVLMDIQMPVMDGLTASEAIRKIEKMAGRSHTPILAMTANALPDDVLATSEAGCNFHIAKPVSKKALLSALAQWEPKIDLPKPDDGPNSDDLAGLAGKLSGHTPARMTPFSKTAA